MPLIVSVQGLASQTGAKKNHLWSSRLLFFGPSQFCGSFLMCGGPKQRKHIQAGDELGFGLPFLGLEGTLFLYFF